MVRLDFRTAFVTNDVVASPDDKEENSEKSDEKNNGRGPVEQKCILSEY